MSNIAILSINHQKAPVAIREKVAFAQGELVPAISALLTSKKLKAVLSFPLATGQKFMSPMTQRIYVMF